MTRLSTTLQAYWNKGLSIHSYSLLTLLYKLAICRSKDLGGDMLLGCASAWFEYGNSLLIKEEDAPSDGLLANAETAPKEDGDEDGDEDGEDKVRLFMLNDHTRIAI